MYIYIYNQAIHRLSVGEGGSGWRIPPDKTILYIYIYIHMYIYIYTYIYTSPSALVSITIRAPFARLVPQQCGSFATHITLMPTKPVTLTLWIHSTCRR